MIKGTKPNRGSFRMLEPLEAASVPTPGMLPMSRGNLTTANRVLSSGEGDSLAGNRAKSFHDRKVSVWFKRKDRGPKHFVEEQAMDNIKSPLTPTEHISIKRSNENLLPAAKIQFYQAKRQISTHES